MKQTRRSVLGAAGALIAGTAGAGYVLADSHTAIEIEVNAEEEYVVLTNSGDEEMDLSGYRVDFENQDPDPQLYPLPEGTVLGAGEQLKVATGYEDVPDADVDFELDAAQIHNTEPDVIALLTPGKETVVASTNINTTTTTTEKGETTETTTEEEKETTTATEEAEEETTTTEEEAGGGDDGSNGEEKPTASVTFQDQDSEGTSVVVQQTTLSDGGFLVIHDASGAVLGHSAYLDAGDHSNVAIDLDSPISSDQTLIAMAHIDDGDQTYEFPGADGPYTADGAPVTDDASVTLVC